MIEKIRELQAKLKKYKKKLKKREYGNYLEMQQEISNLQKQLEQSQSHVQYLNNQLESSQQQISQLTSDNQQLKSVVSQLNTFIQESNQTKMVICKFYC